MRSRLQSDQTKAAQVRRAHCIGRGVPTSDTRDTGSERPNRRKRCSFIVGCRGTCGIRRSPSESRRAIGCAWLSERQDHKVRRSTLEAHRPCSRQRDCDIGSARDERDVAEESRGDKSARPYLPIVRRFENRWAVIDDSASAQLSPGLHCPRRHRTG